MFMMMNNRKQMKQTANKGEGNQEVNLRENINSERDEESVIPQQRDHSKRLCWHKTFNSSNVFSMFSKEQRFKVKVLFMIYLDGCSHTFSKHLNAAMFCENNHPNELGTK